MEERTTEEATTARKRKKETPTSLQNNSNPANARKENPSLRTMPSSKENSPSNKAISLNNRGINPNNRGINPSNREISPSSKGINPSSKGISLSNRTINPNATSRRTPVDMEKANATVCPNPINLINPTNKQRNLPEMKHLHKHKKFLRKNLTLLFIASLFIACDKQTVYHNFQSLPTEGWQREDTLSFQVAVPDSATFYSISVEVRNRNNYPYQNLPLLICYDNPETQNFKKDTLEIRLADSTGVWSGDGWGGLYQSTLRAGMVRIGKAGEYRFRITHLLPDTLLPGINDVGIKLKR